MRGSDYAELKAFAAVAEQGNFARAAARLGTGRLPALVCVGDFDV